MVYAEPPPEFEFLQSVICDEAPRRLRRIETLEVLETATREPLRFTRHPVLIRPEPSTFQAAVYFYGLPARMMSANPARDARGAIMNAALSLVLEQRFSLPVLLATYGGPPTS
jgi:hypothetical protein